MNQLTARYADAVRFAVKEHRQQVRKGTDITYVSHLLAVSALVLEHGGDEDLAIAGLLHDAVEDAHDGDGSTTAERIRDEFGDRVADVVAGCSDTDVVPKPPWRERKERYLADLLDAPPDVAARVGLRQAAQRPLHSRRPTRLGRCLLGGPSMPGPPINAGTTQPCWRCFAAASPPIRAGTGSRRVGSDDRRLTTLVTCVRAR